MTCPECGKKTKVLDLVHNPERQETYRKKKCVECGHIFHTIEFITEYDDIREDWNKHLRGKEKKK